MKNHEAQALFKESELLYRERRYEEALEVLKELDARYPNTRNILYPIAKCFRRLGRFDEAAAVCDRLVLEFDDQKAKHMRRSVQQSLDRAAARTIQVASSLQANIDDEIDAGFDALDLGDLPPLDEEATTVHIPGGYAPPPVVRTSESDVPWLYIGIGAALILILAVTMAFVAGGGATSPDNTPEAAAESGGADLVQLLINMFVFSFFSTLVAYSISLYATLHLREKLPYGTFQDDALSIFGYSLLGTTLTHVLPCIGVIVNIVILRKRFQLTFVDFLVLIGIYIAATIPFYVLSSLLFTAPLNEFMEQAAQTQ